MIEDRILIIPDTHFVMNNPSNRVDLIGEGLDILEWVAQTIKEKEITRVIFLGDIFDRGYDKIDHKIFSDFYMRFKKISEMVNGKVDMVIGNHELTFSKGNPIYHWTFPYKRAWEIISKYEKFPMKEPLLVAPDSLEYSNVYIEFNHFDPNRNYNRYHGYKTLIGLYHDSLSGLSNENFYGSRDPVNIGELMINNSLIIAGHIHIPQEIKIYNNNLNTKVLVPGAMVSRTTAEVHDHVNVPIITIYNEKIDGEYYLLDYVNYNLPEFTDTFNKDIVDKNKTKYEIQKSIKRTRKMMESKLDFETLLSKFPEDSRVKELILTSTNKLEFEGEKDILKLFEKGMGN